MVIVQKNTDLLVRFAVMINQGELTSHGELELRALHHSSSETGPSYFS